MALAVVLASRKRPSENLQQWNVQLLDRLQDSSLGAAQLEFEPKQPKGQAAAAQGNPASHPFHFAPSYEIRVLYQRENSGTLRIVCRRCLLTTADKKYHPQLHHTRPILCQDPGPLLRGKEKVKHGNKTQPWKGAFTECRYILRLAHLLLHNLIRMKLGVTAAVPTNG